MTEGPDQSQDTAERLQGELDELLRQHEQYTLAMDAAVDPRTSLRLQRTLERLDEEIEGLREALKAYEPSQEQPETGSGPGVIPDWDEDEEPATAIYSGVEDVQGAPAGPGLGGFLGAGVPPSSLAMQPAPGSQVPAGFPPAGAQAPAGAQMPPNEDPPTVNLQAQWQGGGTSPAQPTTPGTAPGQMPQPMAPSTTTTVTPPVEQPPMPGQQAASLVHDVATPSGQVAALPSQAPAPPGEEDQTEVQAMRRPIQRPAAPPGGASFTSLPPPAGLEDAPWGHTEIVPPTYNTQAILPRPKEPASPFEAPAPAPAPASPPQPNSPSPFGGSTPSPTGSPYMNTGGYDAVEGSDGEWSVGSRLLLAALVLMFLGGVAYILAQGP